MSSRTVTDHNIRYVPVRLDLREYFNSDEGKAALNKDEHRQRKRRKTGSIQKYA